MKQTAGFSKYAVAFSDNHGDSVNGIEGPEELVQFLVNNKQQKSHPQKTTPKTSSNNSKANPSPKPERKYNNQPHSSSERGNKQQPRPRRNNNDMTASSPDQSSKQNIDSSHHEMAYEHQKGARPINYRGKTRGDTRGGHQIRNSEMFDTKHRVFDRHSGMTKTNVKPSSRTHGRDDFDIKNTVDKEINIDSTGHVNVNNDDVVVVGGDASTNVINDQDTRSYRPRGGAHRQSRGGNSGGRDRYNNSRRGNHSGEPRSYKPRGERGQQPSSSNAHNHPSGQNKPQQPAFLFDDNDFPSFDA